MGIEFWMLFMSFVSSRILLLRTGPMTYSAFYKEHGALRGSMWLSQSKAFRRSLCSPKGL